MYQLENRAITERFYSIDHLTTEQLRELYTSYREYGWTDAQFYGLMPEGVEPAQLSPGEIILNIDGEHEMNYFVIMIDCQEEEDGIMIGLGMLYHPTFVVYLHLPLRLLNELVLKYNLTAKQEAKNYTITEYLMDQTRNNSLN